MKHNTNKWMNMDENTVKMLHINQRVVVKTDIKYRIQKGKEEEKNIYIYIYFFVCMGRGWVWVCGWGSVSQSPAKTRG